MGVLETTYNTAMDKPLQILGIFNDFFGEDKVDMQGFPTYAEVASALPEKSSVRQVKDWIANHCTNIGNTGFILVHFPHVVVKNEHDRSTEVNHLYAKVAFDIDGKMYGRFLLNRAEYTMLHITNGYMHSHISSIPFSNFTQFQSPCTGTGPINNTICSLSRDFDTNIWRLFCLELSKYVEVESIAGTPYHRLEGLTRGGRTHQVTVAESLGQRDVLDVGEFRNSGLNRTDFALFTKYLIDKEVLKFMFVEGEYKIAMSPTDCAIRVSNAFIDWYNKEFKAHRKTTRLSDLISYGIFLSCKFSNGRLVRTVTNTGIDRYSGYIGRLMCTFKGQPVTISISDYAAPAPEENEVLILKISIIEYILTKIINVINFRYGNKRNEEDSSSKKVYFL